MINNKIFLSIVTVLFFSSISNSVSAKSYVCTNIQGISTKFVKGQISSGKDGFAGTTITINVDTSEKEKKQHSAIWTGNNKINEPIMFLNMEKNDGWMSFLAIRKSVIRTYTIHFKKQPPLLGFTESQTQLFTGVPQIRSYFAQCR
jgi:hypothetical protein